MKKCKICKKKLLQRQKKFCSKKCYGLFLKENPDARNHFKKGAKAWNKGLKGYHAGKDHWNWQGGRRKHPEGYIEFYCPNHPHARHGGYVYEHRYVMEKELGRFLEPTERVHHINKNPSDNRIENLKLFASSSEHQKYHHWLKKNPE